VVTLLNNHLQYTLTWYGLAGVLVISFVTWAFGSEEAGGVEDAPPAAGHFCFSISVAPVRARRRLRLALKLTLISNQAE
jgi:hypothetical protein